MADLDVRKNAEAIADLFASYFEQFIELVTKPRTGIRAQFASDVPRTKRIQNSIIYSASGILIGFCVAKLVGIPNSPDAVNPQTAVAILFLWILSAAIVHPFLKLFGGKGDLQDTIVVFLLVISTVHLLFLPVLAVASHLLTDTQVTLSYDYVIYFGLKSSERSQRQVWTQVNDWHSRYFGEHSETFIKEKEPLRAKTVIPPASDLNDYPSAGAVPISPEVRPRVSSGALNQHPPSRTETPVIREGLEGLLFVFWLFYYAVNSVYLAAGLSVPHQKNASLLFLLAVIGPLSIPVSFLLGLVIYWRVFL